MPAGRVLALFVWFGAAAAAQRYADLHGWILDTGDGGIADAMVTVVNEDTGFRRVTQSETGGAYTVTSLRPGLYKISVRKEGFIPMVRFGVRLASGAATRADFILPVGTRTESITVYGNPPLLDRQDVSTGASVDRDQIERLPLDGRGLLTLLEFTPGTNVTPATRGEAGQFTATGQRPNTNYFTVDGVSANTGVAAGGLPAQSTGGSLPALSAFGSMDSLISLEGVQDLRVTTSTSSAEMGRLPGANVAINSRIGTNEFHGATMFRIRNELWSANTWFANQAGYGPLPLRLLGLSQTFGGPLKRDRTFFLLSFETPLSGSPTPSDSPCPPRTAARRPRTGRRRCSTSSRPPTLASPPLTDPANGSAAASGPRAQSRRGTAGPGHRLPRLGLRTVQRLAFRQPVRHPDHQPTRPPIPSVTLG